MLKISEKILQITPPPNFLYYFIQRRPEASQVAAMLKNLCIISKEKLQRRNELLTIQIYYHNPEIKY